MAQQNDFWTKFQALPQEIKDIFLQNNLLNANIEIIEKFNFSEEQIQRFLDIIDRIILKEISLDKVFDSLSDPSFLRMTDKEKINLDEEKTKSLFCDLLGLRFLALQFYLGDVEKYILEFKGNLIFYQERLEKVFSLENLFKEVIDLIIKRSEILESGSNLIEADKTLVKSDRSFTDEQRKRLFHLLISRLEFREKQDVENRLVQPFSQGGMGLSLENAKKMNEEIETAIGEREISKEKIEKAKEMRIRVLGRK